MVIMLCQIVFPAHTSCLDRLKLADGLPNNIVVLETHLAHLNAEVRRFDSSFEDKKLTLAERKEIQIEENKLRLNDEASLRTLYLSRAKFLIAKLVEKLADLYLDHYQSVYNKAGINLEDTRKDLYVYLLKTNYRDFSPSGIRVITKLKNLVIAQGKSLDARDKLMHHIQQLSMVIDSENYGYAKTCLERCISAEEAKKIPTGNSQILKMAEVVRARLIDSKKSIYSEMESRNLKILAALGEIPSFDYSFDVSGFDAFVHETPSNRIYRDAIWPLIERFEKDKNRIYACCGRLCGFNCPYLVGVNIPVPPTKVITPNPILAMYRAIKDFRKQVPAAVLSFPTNKDQFSRQLRLIREDAP